MGYRTDVPVQKRYHTIFGGVLAFLKRYRAIWGIAAIAS